ncbi:helix-turn-helix transcriptional regulator [Natronorarus salvus]|uniref:helix-turn-helix transcriptional regulator n=1 Tax=Natronorarus salvus TaxID=3117733 RepID=UPI002F2613E9
MIGETLSGLGVLFALGTGLSAGVLAALSWRVFRGSPVGSSLATLAAVMSLATIYHTSVLVTGAEAHEPGLLGTAMYLAALGACYVIVRTHRRIAVPIRGYRRFALLAVVGGVGFAVGGFTTKLLLSEAVHWVHGGSALFLCVGLYGTLETHLGNDRWLDRLVREPHRARSAEWMRPLDDAILEVLSRSGLVLTPAVIAFNLGYSREEVNRRIRKLEERGFVERIERGKYRLATRGERSPRYPTRTDGHGTATGRSSDDRTPDS